MELRPLGSTGLRVSPIGLGTVKLGRNRSVKYPQAFELPDDRAAAALLDRARALGVNLLDTAPAYGVSEERLGALLSAGAGGGRQGWVIVTKAGEEFDAATGESRFDFSAAAIQRSVERSLRRLRTDRVEVVLLHSDGRDEWILRESRALGALEGMKRAGSIGAIGISTKTAAGAMLAAGTGMCDVVMLTYNAQHRDDEPAIDGAAARGAGVLVKKALSSGHMGGGGSADVALRFALSRPGVSCVVVGTIDPEHLQQNVAAVE